MMEKLGEFELNKIYCMDCLEGLKKIPDNSVDLILTDPPYNIGDKNKRTKVGNKIVSNFEAWGEWDNYEKEQYDNFIISIIKETYRILKIGGVFYMFSAREDNGFFIRKAIEVGFTYNNQLAIIKDNPLPHFNKNNFRSAFELCFYVSKGKPKIFNFISQQECVNIFHYLIGKKDTEHPTEKPIKFIRKLIKISSNENDVCLDMFMGSGITALACKQLGRNFIGFEKCKNYCDMANKRLQQEVLL